MLINVIYTDFEKAFDRVDHIIPLRKLVSCGNSQIFHMTYPLVCLKVLPLAPFFIMLSVCLVFSSSC